MAVEGPDLEDRLKPFPEAFVHELGHGTYVTHSVVVQRLLDLFGYYELRIIREIYDGATLTGCLTELTVHTEGGPVVIQEFGDCGKPELKDTNGERAKHAASDALKRCAMRLGIGLHLWSGAESYLHNKLKEADEDE